MMVFPFILVNAERNTVTNHAIHATEAAVVPMK